MIFDGVNVLIVLRTVNSTDAAKELKANSLVNPKGRAGKGEGERFYLKSEQISQKNKSQTEKRFSLALSGDLTGIRTRVYAVRGRRLNRLTIRPPGAFARLPM